MSWRSEAIFPDIREKNESKSSPKVDPCPAELVSQELVRNAHFPAPGVQQFAF